MISVVALALIAFQTSKPYPDRAKFLHQLAALPEGAPRAEVLKVLGAPDRIKRENVGDHIKSVVQETWDYGTDSPTDVATLARFVIFDGKLAYHPVNADPPPVSVISEKELRKGIHIVLDKMPREYWQSEPGNKNFSIWIALTANALLPLGDAKCKAVMGECGRLMESYSELNPCPYFLCYALFDPPAKTGRFDVFGPVWQAPKPDDGKSYPRWPVEIVNNVPIVRGEPIGAFGGYAPSFNSAFKQLRSRIQIRTSPLALPN